jgi:hypothetical protein
MIITKRRIRFELAGGQWSYWMSVADAKRYRAENIKSAVIEETMSYADAMRYLSPKVISAGLDQAISDELRDKPGSIMGPV